jgi:hypothetical protein
MIAPPRRCAGNERTTDFRPQPATDLSTAEKKLLMLFVCFFVFFCVFVCCSVFRSMPDRFAIAQAALDNRLHGVIHAGGILTEGLGKEKPTVGKKSDFSWNFNSRAGEEDG